MSRQYIGPYINFQGRAREAMEFYHVILGGKLDAIHFQIHFGTGMKIKKMDIAVMDSDLVDPPWNERLDGINPDSTDAELTLAGVGTLNQIDLWIKYRDGGSSNSMQNLRPLQ